MPAAETRSVITEAADRLFYERGFETTSLADVAAEVGLSRGNFYYHFKTKDEILGAVIARRRAGTRDMLDAWDAAASSPLARVGSFIDILTVNRSKIMAFGCPVGTLCDELAKLDHAARTDAAGLFTMFREWLAVQFAALGRERDADQLALHILMRSQGVATLAAAFRDEAFIAREIAAMKVWVAAQRPAGEGGSYAHSRPD